MKPKRNMLAAMAAMAAKATPKPDAKPDMTANPAKKSHGHPHKNLGHYLHKAKKK